jgi:hypothetical protein
MTLSACAWSSKKPVAMALSAVTLETSLIENNLNEPPNQLRALGLKSLGVISELERTSSQFLLFSQKIACLPEQS